MILAEAVGSCTDLAATVIRPLQRQYRGALRVAPLLVAVDPTRLLEFAKEKLTADELELGWLLHTQLEEADTIVLTKSDLALDLDATTTELRADYPHTPLLSVSATTGEQVDELMESWLGPASPAAVAGAQLNIDYSRYGRAEALMSWSDVQLELTADEPFSLNDWLADMLAAVNTAIIDTGSVIGHVKATVTAEDGDGAGQMAKGSLVAIGRWHVDRPADRHATTATALINARVCVPVAALASIIDIGVAEASATEIRYRVSRRTEFAPAQPVPTHRIPA